MPNKKSKRHHGGIPHSVAETKQDTVQLIEIETVETTKSASFWEWIKTNKLNIMILLGIMVVTFLVYLQSISNGWINLDDDVYFFNNPNLIGDSVNWSGLWNDVVSYNWHPITMLLIGVWKSLFGLTAKSFHTLSIITHSINAGLVFIFMMKLMNYFKDEIKHPLYCSVFIALFVGLNPMQTENTLWASEVKTLFCTFFILLSSMNYLKYRESAIKKFYYISIVLAILACGSKSFAVIIPILFLIFEFFLLKQNKFEWKHSIVFFIIAFITGIIALQTQSNIIDGFEMLHSSELNIEKNILNYRAYAVLIYFIKSIFPHGQRFVYEFRNDEIIRLSIFIVVILGLLFFLLKKKRLVSIGIVLFMVGILPMINISFSQVMLSERYVYFSMIGLGYILVWFFGKNTTRQIGGIAYIAILGLLTTQRFPVWENNKSLYTESSTVDGGPASYGQLANTYLENKDTLSAIHSLEKRINSSIIIHQKIDALERKGILLYTQGNFKESLFDFEQILQSDLPTSLAYIYKVKNLQKIDKNKVNETIDLAKKEFPTDPDIAQLRKINISTPRPIYTQKNTAVIERAVALMQKRDFINPEKIIRDELVTDSTCVDCYKYLAVCLANQGKLKESMYFAKLYKKLAPSDSLLADKFIGEIETALLNRNQIVLNN